MRVSIVLLLAGLTVPALAASCASEEESDDDGRFNTDTSSSTSSGVGIGGAGGNPVGPGPGSGGNTTSSSTGSTSGGGAPCPDGGPEPNNNEASATNLGAIDDCDSSGSMVSGTLAGNDVDWYVYQGSDVSLCSVDPYRSITSDGQARVCKYPDCLGQVTTCPAGTTQDTSPDLNLVGCCSLNPFNLAVDCNGLSDDATIYIRVDKPPALACVNYTLSFHY